MTRFAQTRLASLALAALAATFIATALVAQGAPNPDPRVGLKAGWWDAAQAAWNMRLVSTTRPSADFVKLDDPGNFSFMNSDMAFDGKYVIQGNFRGFHVWDVSDPAKPALVKAYLCPAMQSDVSVYRNLLFVSAESNDARLDCGTQGVQDTVSKDRIRGIRIFDITDIANPKYVGNVQTCRGSHTHTIVTDPKDTGAVYVYISGQAGVRSPNELAGCSHAMPEQDTSSAYFRIEVIRVPLAHPEQAQIVNRPRIFEALAKPPSHGAAPQDSIEAAQMAAAARAKGAFTVRMQGVEMVVPPGFVNGMLDSLVHARGGTGAPTAADSAKLREILQPMVDKMMQGPGYGTRSGPDQCHDITVYPQLGIAGGACAGYGLLLDIKDPVHPTRIAFAGDSNFAYWHSATFNNDGTKVLFTDEWGGGVAPKCRATDRKEWGADAIFTIADNKLNFQGYYKMPAPQTAMENCVAHNGSLVPVPGRDIMVQGWYQGGVSVFDFTDPKHPTEIAFFDRGPMDSTKLEPAGSWSAYWYNGHIYSSEIARGLDILDLTPNAMLTQNELEAAKTVQVAYQNVQDQQRIVWPASFALAGAYADQLERSKGLSATQLSGVRSALANAEKATGSKRKTDLTQLATKVDGYAAGSSDQGKVKLLAGAVRDLANAK